MRTAKTCTLFCTKFSVHSSLAVCIIPVKQKPDLHYQPTNIETVRSLNSKKSLLGQISMVGGDTVSIVVVEKLKVKFSLVFEQLHSATVVYWYRKGSVYR